MDSPNNNDPNKKKIVKKAGKTLLVKFDNENYDKEIHRKNIDLCLSFILNDNI